MGYLTQWFDFLKCTKLFVDMTQPLGAVSQPPAFRVASEGKGIANRSCGVSKISKNAKIKKTLFLIFKIMLGCGLWGTKAGEGSNAKVGEQSQSARQIIGV